jgi:hypothetical protein
VIAVYPGWFVYSVDLTNLGVAGGPTWAASNPIQSLRLDPVFMPNINVQVDWARLTVDDATLYRTINWTGAGNVDIYLDNDTNFANGYVGQIATNVSGGSLSYFIGALPAGTYYVAIRAAGTANAPNYSSAPWTVNDIPTLTFTSPNPEGSTDDFATTQIGNAWDMNATSDIDLTFNVAGAAITNVPAQDEAGANLGNVRVYSGVTTSNFGDPELFPLHWTKRGATTHIDSNRYRILSLKWGIKRDRDINAGSIGRIIWRVFGETVENVSLDLILRHLPNVNVIQNIIADMKAIPLVAGAGSPSHTGWNGMLDGFRIKPDEFNSATNFYVQYVKLSAFEIADTSYMIQWQYSNLGGASPTLQLYWDSTGTGFNTTNQIATGLNPTTGSYSWNTSALAAGTYYIFARIMNGATVMNQTYARWPIVINHSGGPLPTLTLDRSKLNFGATNNGTTITSGQVVHVNTASNVGWTVSANQPYVMVNPTSGTGSGSFTVTVQSSTFPSPSLQNATVTVSSGGVSNSPQTVQVSVNVFNPPSATPPVGSFDTPANNSTGIAGAVPVTGWSLDSVETTKIDIWREPLAGETPQSFGLIYIGDATFVDGARPDVAASFSTYPLNTRAGWGYMLLTNFLPNNGGSPGLGNGTYNLHAIAHNPLGLTTDLGTRTITVDNAHASRPFGTIDTPGQGGTASGSSFVNFGWALTQNPNCVPTDASTITVTIDGVTVGHPVYNNFRNDIATSFPGRCNSNGAIGFYIFDTTALANGVHTIGWLVYDNVGHGDGVGSRFFNVFNSGPVASPPETAAAVEMSAPTAAHRSSASHGRVALRHGIDDQHRGSEVLTADDRGRYSVSTEEIGRIELEVGAVKGYQIIAGERHRLPIGSTLKEGVFYWQPGPGFLGEFELSFERADGTEVPVRVLIRPKTFSRDLARQ